MVIDSKNVFEFLSNHKQLKYKIPELDVVFKKWFFATYHNKHDLVREAAVEALKLLQDNSNTLGENIEINILDSSQTRHCLLEDSTQVYSNFCISRDEQNTYLTTWR